MKYSFHKSPASICFWSKNVSVNTALKLFWILGFGGSKIVWITGEAVMHLQELTETSANFRAASDSVKDNRFFIKLHIIFYIVCFESLGLNWYIYIQILVWAVLYPSFYKLTYPGKSPKNVWPFAHFQIIL